MVISYNDIKMPEKWKLFDTIKKIIDETKHGENAPVLDVAEVVAVQFSR